MCAVGTHGEKKKPLWDLACARRKQAHQAHKHSSMGGLLSIVDEGKVALGGFTAGVLASSYFLLRDHLPRYWK